MTVPELDARQAAALAAGMKAVALADGEPHPAEIGLIDDFSRGLPHDIDVSGVRFSTPEVRSILLRSLYLVGLVDGALEEVERSTIHAIGTAHGATPVELSDAEASARRQLLRRLRGVRVFRERALEVAEELGVPREEAERMLDEEVSEDPSESHEPG